MESTCEQRNLLASRLPARSQAKKAKDEDTVTKNMFQVN